MVVRPIARCIAKGKWRKAQRDKAARRLPASVSTASASPVVSGLRQSEDASLWRVRIPGSIASDAPHMLCYYAAMAISSAKEPIFRCAIMPSGSQNGVSGTECAGAGPCLTAQRHYYPHAFRSRTPHPRCPTASAPQRTKKADPGCSVLKPADRVKTPRECVVFASLVWRKKDAGDLADPASYSAAAI